MPASGRARLSAAAVGMLVAVVTFLPFARGLARGESFYFRDLGRQFLPVRGFLVDGLLKGELRYWNPHAYEGEPTPLPPIAYPVDLLQAIVPHEHGVSLVLALHVPLAAMAFLALARGLGLSLAGAATGGIVYALGGFCLSSLNLYVQLEAMAWAPLVVLGLWRAARGGPRDWALAAAFLALALSTTGGEVVAQAVLFGVVLSLAKQDVGRRLLRLAGVACLGAGLAAAPLAVVRSLVADSARTAGFAPRVTLGFAVHPMTLLQVVVSSLYGEPENYTDHFWGNRFFPAFPYLLSLYLGATVLALALVGAAMGRLPRRRILVLAALGLVLSLGARAGLGLIVEHVPFARAFRYPSKAFLLVHFAIALLAAAGVDAMTRDDARRAWRWLLAACLALGTPLAVAPLAAHLMPGVMLSATSEFFPEPYSDSLRLNVLRFILKDARAGGLVALAAGLVALLWLTRRVGRLGVVALAGLVATDLIRAGAGLNPTASPSFFRLSPETARVIDDLRSEGGRVFACDPELAPPGSVYWKARSGQLASLEIWAIATAMETLTTYYNVRFGVANAYGRDLTGFVPLERALPASEAGCGSFADIAGRLRRAGVAHVLSLLPLGHPDLDLRVTLSPARIAPATLHAYALRNPLPLRAVASAVEPAQTRKEAETTAARPGFQSSGATSVEGGTAARGVAGRILSDVETSDRLELVVEADAATVLLVRDAFAPGWIASVDGVATPVLRADGRHRAVPIGPGRSRVELRYETPGLTLGSALTFVSAALVAALWWVGGRKQE